MIALIALTPAAGQLARRLKAALGDAETHGRAGRVDDADIAFTDTAAHLRALFAAGRPIVAICATGVVIRALAPVLADKLNEPPVLAVAVDGACVVPLLNGHRGGNDLAARIAAVLGGVAAVTTQGPVGLDAPPPGWRIGTPDRLTAVAAALTAGEPVALSVEAGDAGWLAPLNFAGAGAVRVRVTDKIPASPDELVFHPPVLAAGVGCERNASPQALETLLATALAEAGLAEGAVACVASIDLKADEAAVHALPHPARFFTALELEAERGRLQNPSEAVFRATGCHGVAEAAALAAAGPDSVLVVPKRKGAGVTVAIARSATMIDPNAVGRARGKLFVVGTGPGNAVWRTPEASRAVAASTDLVGYGLYLDLLGEAAFGKTRHESGLGAETERVRMALDLAAQGRTVSLVCSGDPGIYALATLVFECVEQDGRADWGRVDIQVVPGVTAMQAAAARVGAPLNHDFCAVSLSDLLTPWPAIERRLTAAAEGDFVVGLYNPVSKRRRDQLARAKAILAQHRPPTTPVVLARQLGRADEKVITTTLAELSVDQADMLTVIVIGNSQTRLFSTASRQWIYTPRGYADRYR